MTMLVGVGVALLWAIGAGLRVRRHVRFLQIEEYENVRYLRWAAGRWARLLPPRLSVAWALGLVLCALADAPGRLGVAAHIGVLGLAAVALWPTRDREVKKIFRPTSRAVRLLATAMLLAGALIGGGVYASTQTDAAPRALGAVHVAGGLAALGAPLLLVAGNIFMQPVEAAVRARFVRLARRNLVASGAVVVGITGSYGKTSTKTYLAHLLGARYRVVATPKSYNTLMGVCLAINDQLAKAGRTDYFICEMGAYIPGEIARICELTHPRIGIIIEVGPQHLERFGTLENVAIAKYELVRALPPEGLCAFNADNAHVRAMAERGHPVRRVLVTQDAANPHQATLAASEVAQGWDGLHFTLTEVRTGNSARFETPLLGAHNVVNVALATAIALEAGIPLSDCARRARTLAPAESRLVRNVLPNGITVLNDAYSANPVGVMSALGTLALANGGNGGRRMVITPGMVELGPLMEHENRRLGVGIAQAATDVVLVGIDQTRPIAESLASADFPAEHVLVVETLAEAVAHMQQTLTTGDTVLFMNDLPDTYLTGS